VPEKLIHLPQGTVIHGFATYDNTLNNPFNPSNPPVEVSWGENTTDEMYYLSMTFVEYQEGDEDVVLSTRETGHLTDHKQPQFLGLSPNPAQDEAVSQVFVPTFQEVSLDVFDLQGKLVRRAHANQMLHSGSHSLPINLRGLSPGIYNVRLTMDQGVLGRKLVVQE